MAALLLITYLDPNAPAVQCIMGNLQKRQGFFRLAKDVAKQRGGKKTKTTNYWSLLAQLFFCKIRGIICEFSKKSSKKRATKVRHEAQHTSISERKFVII